MSREPVSACCPGAEGGEAARASHPDDRCLAAALRAAAAWADGARPSGLEARSGRARARKVQIISRPVWCNKAAEASLVAGRSAAHGPCREPHPSTGGASRIPNSLGRIRPTCVASAQCGPRRVVARQGATAPGRTVAACVQRALLDSHPVTLFHARRTEAKCTRLSVLARHAAVAVDRLAASGRLPVDASRISSPDCGVP